MLGQMTILGSLSREAVSSFPASCLLLQWNHSVCVCVAGFFHVDYICKIHPGCLIQW